MHRLIDLQVADHFYVDTIHWKFDRGTSQLGDIEITLKFSSLTAELNHRRIVCVVE